MIEGNKIIVPFLKWAGGKRWLVAKHPNLFPTHFKRYCEPFLGSASVYFYLRPERALLSDVNGDLINTYLALKHNDKTVVDHLRRHQKRHSKSYYYEQRNKTFRSPSARAAQFIYLNRTCWNGLYRVNREGAFNVPIGSKASVLLDSDDFSEVSKLLRTAEIRVADFEGVIAEGRRGDFIFVDPPYTVAHNHNGFIKYNESLFSWQDQERLRDSVEMAASRGVKILVMNACHESISKLYSGFKKVALTRNSVLAGDAKCRGSYQEYAIRCW